MSLHQVPAVDLDIPEHAGLSIRVYGHAKAQTAEQTRQQAFYVTLNGATIARSELSDEHKAAVKNFLTKNYPEHAQL